MKTCKRIALWATAMTAFQQPVRRANALRLIPRAAVTVALSAGVHVAVATLACSMFTTVVVAQTSAARQSANSPAMLNAGSELSVRTLSPLDGEARTRGKTVRAMVIAPLMSNSRVLIAPRTILEGTVLNTGSEQEGGKRQYVQLRFTSMVLTDGTHVAANLVISNIDNSRETTDNDGRILGPPKSSLIKSKADWGALALGSLNPIGGAVFFAAERGETDERHRKINYPAGVDMTATVVGTVTLPGWPEYALPDSLAIADSARRDLLSRVPLRALAVGGRIPGDFVNIVLLGNEASVRSAFASAGWDSPDHMSTKSDFDTFIKAAEGQGYSHQPVSQQLMFGRAPDLVFQRVTDTFAKRHHVRMWRTDVQILGQQVWVAAATHDIGVEFSKAHRSFTHRVDSAIDIERDKIVNDLLTASQIQQLSYVQRAPAPESAARGDFASDWRVALLRTVTTPPNP